MIIGKKEKDRSGLMGKDLIGSIASPLGHESIIRKRGNSDYADRVQEPSIR